MTSQSTRDIILKAAKELFAERGYYSTTVDDVAERAGVAKGSIYTYFNSKYELFVTALLQDFEEIVRKIDEKVGNIDRIEERIFRGVDIYLDYFEGNLFFFKSLFLERRVLVKESQGEAEDGFWKLYQRFTDQLASAFQIGIDRGEIKPLNPRVLAIGLIGGIDRILFSCLRKDEKTSPRENVRVFLEAFFNGVKRTPPKTFREG
ncbi:MAG: hypothetical protein DRQ06_03760 [Candidatus Hydrothermota bacterium]|nr:MAG: hypothetical protein DRQ06_03760 [Candidatus Hydrothermae bacterium]